MRNASVTELLNTAIEDVKSHEYTTEYAEYWSALEQLCRELASDAGIDPDGFVSVLNALDAYKSEEWGESITTDDIIEMLNGATRGLAYTTLGDDEEFETQVYLDFGKLKIWQELWDGPDVVASELIEEFSSWQELGEWLDGAEFNWLISYIDYEDYL